MTSTRAEYVLKYHAKSRIADSTLTNICRITSSSNTSQHPCKSHAAASFHGDTAHRRRCSTNGCRHGPFWQFEAHRGQPHQQPHCTQCRTCKFQCCNQLANWCASKSDNDSPEPGHQPRPLMSKPKHHQPAHKQCTAALLSGIQSTKLRSKQPVLSSRFCSSLSDCGP